MTTMELAVGIMAAMFLATILAWTVSLVVVQTQCSDSAAAIARYSAIADPAKVEQARGAAPQGANVSIRDRGNAIEVVVTVDRYLGVIGPIHLTGTATQLKEPR